MKNWMHKDMECTMIKLPSFASEVLSLLLMASSILPSFQCTSSLFSPLSSPSLPPFFLFYLIPPYIFPNVLPSPLSFPFPPSLIPLLPSQCPPFPPSSFFYLLLPSFLFPHLPSPLLLLLS